MPNRAFRFAPIEKHFASLMMTLGAAGDEMVEKAG